MKIFQIASLRASPSILPIANKVSNVEKSHTSDNSQFGQFEQEINEIPKITNEPVRSSNEQTRNLSAAPVPQSNDEVDKKMKQIMYVRELEEQIKIRDKIKNEEEQRRIKKLGAYQPEIDDFKFEPQVQQKKQEKREENVQSSPPKPNSSKDRRGIGSAPKALDSAIVSQAMESDPFGGNIPIRKKISNRIDQELESRGSIFSGRDEKSILIRKRNIEQQHMREELLRQIEEKKNREEDIKKRKRDEDMREEMRIKQEIQQYGDENEVFTSTYKPGNLSLQRHISDPSPSYLPELTNRQETDVVQELQKADEELEMIKSKSVENNFETTAAFANYTPNNHHKDIQNENNQKANKIKEMIDQ